MPVFSFRNARILALLLVLASVAVYVKDQKLVTQGWYKTLEIVVYPINPDNDPIVRRYIDSLSTNTFSRLDAFIQREAAKYNTVTRQPTKTRLGQTLTLQPPQPPRAANNPLQAIVWSLKLRYWVWKHAPKEAGDNYLVRMFVNYHPPSISRLHHSVGLQKGLIGVVNAYASKSQSGQNNIVIAHEFFHTVGATVKYDALGQPSVPDGLGEPSKSPLFPQQKTEIMAGRRAISPRQSEMPAGFKHIVVGRKTAREIGWLDE